MAAGAALIVLTDLVFIFVSGYSVSSIIWVVAMLTLIVLFFRNRMPAGVLTNLDWVLIGLAAIAVLIGLRWLVGDVVFILTPPAGLGVPRLLGMIGLYAGVGLMGLGAYRLWTSQRR
jgi:hypothetical protein